MNEKKLAGANYLISFFNQIQQLNNDSSVYINYINHLNHKYGEDSDDVEKAIDEQEKQFIIQLVQAVRHSARQAFRSYLTIYSVAELKRNKDLEITYRGMIDQFIINRVVLEEFVLMMNKSFLADVIQDLLVTSQDLVKQFQ